VNKLIKRVIVFKIILYFVAVLVNSFLAIYLHSQRTWD